MWNHMLTGLSIGARIILYDGSPFYPSLVDYLKLIDTQKSVKTNLVLCFIEPGLAYHAWALVPVSWLKFKAVA